MSGCHRDVLPDEDWRHHPVFDQARAVAASNCNGMLQMICYSSISQFNKTVSSEGRDKVKQG